jgi:SAM-dependent methyltransferase
MKSVANVGAGTGSYEPTSTAVAIEPSAVMLAQRPSGAAPAVQATAEHIPLQTNSVDATLAILTLHHWPDLAGGIVELTRVARRRIVILTWDHVVIKEFWLLQEYLPEIAKTDTRLAVPIERIAGLLPGAMVTPVPVPHDCVDGFGAAYWRRPSAYLDPTVRAGISMLALTDPGKLTVGLERLRADIASGAWADKHAELLDQPEFDAGYRLIVAGLPDS